MNSHEKILQFRDRQRFSVLLACLALVILKWSPQCRAAIDDPATLLSDSSLILVEVTRGDELIDRILDPKFQDLLKAIPDLRESLEGEPAKRAYGVLQSIADQVDLTPEELIRTLVGGGIAMGMEPVANGSDPAIVLIVSSEDPDLLNTAHERLVNLSRAFGGQQAVKQMTYRGLTGTSFGEGEYHTIYRNNLVLSNNGEVLKGVVDRILDSEEGGVTLGQSKLMAKMDSTVGRDDLARAIVDLKRVREIDPDRFAKPEEVNSLATLLFGNWIESAYQTPVAVAGLTWDSDRLGLKMTMERFEGGLEAPYLRFVPEAGQGARMIQGVPSAIAQLSLWRNLGDVWEIRDEIFTPEALQGFAQLDTTAGQFLGGRDFGTGVLGALGSDWNLLVAEQTYDEGQPIPDIQLPAFALVIERNPDDPQFGLQVQVAFQTFIGLANIGISMNGGTPLILGNEMYKDVSISTARYQNISAPEPIEDDIDLAEDEDDEGTDTRIQYNFRPSFATTETHIILSSTLPLARDLIEALENPSPATDRTLQLAVNGAAVADLFEKNRERLVMQNMLDEGNDRKAAESEIKLFIDLVRYLGRGRLEVIDDLDGEVTFHLAFDLLDESSR